MQYPDDCALPAHTSEELQEMITVTAQIYQSFCLEINDKMTDVLVWTYRSPSNFIFTINQQPLNVVPRFKYMSSFLSNYCRLDDEVENRVKGCFKIKASPYE